jgi:anthranilate synthase component 1
MVVSRNFQRSFRGDEFNVYRALRALNPSPYLFYFDRGDHRLFGSSPESQLKVRSGKVMIDPIAGTIGRSGDEEKDREAADELTHDPKENAEHNMLVDLARNDLSRGTTDVRVEKYKEVQAFSHVFHMVSRVAGDLPRNGNPVRVLAHSFPAGTLSGAPKYKAMELINRYEPYRRGHYGGSVGYLAFNGDLDQAITIRSFLSKDQKLQYRAGAGIVADSFPEKEREEVDHKLAALRKALEQSERIHHERKTPSL